MSLSSIPRAVREFVFARDLGRCRYCRLHQLGQGAVFHVNHVIPRSKGGLTTLENLVLQCPNCSLHKSNKMEGHDSKTETWISIFHPLQQNWPEHFVILADAVIVGMTATGRITVDALRMNDLIPQAARFLQMKLGFL